MQRNLQLLSNKSFVCSPRTPLEVLEAYQKEHIWTNFGLSKYGEKEFFFRACIIEVDFTYCIFTCSKIIQLMVQNIPTYRNFLIDGTFACVPLGSFKQLVIIYIEYFEKVSLLFYL